LDNLCHINVDILNNVRCETSTHFRTKRGYSWRTNAKGDLLADS